MVAKVLNLNNLSWQRQPFALSNDGRKGYSFVLECNNCIIIMHRKSHSCNFCHFFPATFAGPQAVEIKKFCYLVDVM